MTFLPADQEGNVWRYLCSIQTCDFRMLPDVICALGDLTELGRKHRICCLSHTQEGPWASKEILLHKSSTPKAPVRGGSGALRCLPQFAPIKQGTRLAGVGSTRSKLTSKPFPHPLPLGHGRKWHTREQFKLRRVHFNLNFRP